MFVSSDGNKQKNDEVKMKQYYCPECGKKGYHFYWYLISLPALGSVSTILCYLIINSIF